MRDAPVIDATVGALRMHTEERGLTIEGATAPLRLAAFRGAALAEEPIEPALDAIEAGAPTLQVVLGDLGDDQAHVETLLGALATLPRPTLVVMGGRDHPADVAAAIAALPEDVRPRIVDASGLRVVRVAGVELVPVAGAPDGRYARDDDACGLGASDAESIAGDVGSGDAVRFVIGWAAPSPLRGIEGGEAGAASVAGLVTAIAARGGVYAWPDVRSAGPAWIVPAIAGPPTVLTDGSRLEPGVTTIEIGPEGPHAIEAP
jgi:hypothetical protein